MTSPRALTATSAATTRPFGSVIAALPMPPFMARPRPPILPTVAPAPAPTLPSATGPSVAAFAASISAVGGRAGSSDRRRRGRRESPPGTIGMTAPPNLKPTPCCSRYRITPLAASRPKRAAAAEHDRVHLLDARRRREQIRFARAGRAAAHVDARRRAFLGEHDRAPGRTLGERVVPDLEARHRRQAARRRGLRRADPGARSSARRGRQW